MKGVVSSRTYFPSASKKEKRIPAHYEYGLVLDVSFEVYEVKSGMLVINRKDKRERGRKNYHLSMFERSCEVFFKELNKKFSWLSLLNDKEKQIKLIISHDSRLIKISNEVINFDT